MPDDSAPKAPVSIKPAPTTSTRHKRAKPVPSPMKKRLPQDADLHHIILFFPRNFVLWAQSIYLCPMSHTSLTYHIIFGTYRRQNVIIESHEKELYKYIFDFARERGIFIWRIGGMPDHIHILCDIPAKIAVADFIKRVKSESSKFMNVNPHFPDWIKWAEKYGAFTVDASLRETRRQYIMKQKEHHRNLSFVDEYRLFLREAGFSEDAPVLGDVYPIETK